MSLTPNTDSPFTYVPVPNEHVPAVMTYLAELLNVTPALTRATSSTPAAAPVVSPSAGDWSDDELKAFLAAETKTAEIVGNLLDHLAQTPGEAGSLSTSEVAEVLGLTYSQIKALPTQMTRTLRKHFSGKGSPLSAKWGPEFSPARTAELYYFVTSERAEQFARIRRRQGFKYRSGTAGDPSRANLSR